MNSEIVKRYDPIQHFDQGGSGYGQVEEKLDGDFVKVEDYQALEKQNQDLRKELDKAREALARLTYLYESEQDCGDDPVSSLRPDWLRKEMDKIEAEYIKENYENITRST